MPNTRNFEVKDLSLDLHNFRTVPQIDEKSAIKAIIHISPDRFYAIIESLVTDGYIYTENIILLEDREFIVKEGNRRIAALKLLHGIYDIKDFLLPADISSLIQSVDSVWKSQNLEVPCTLFSLKESDLADRVVSRAHAKGEKAGRDPWNSVARARHNRDVKKVSEPALDVLEKFLNVGSNITVNQSESWAGDYPITVLAELLNRVHDRLGFLTVADLVKSYPKISNLGEFENMLRDIGLGQLTFDILRDKSDDFGKKYGLSPVALTAVKSTKAQSSIQSGPSATSAVIPTSVPVGTSVAPKAFATTDPKHVSGLLRKFVIRGSNRDKVVLIREEMKSLNLSKTPIAFCFLLRSAFEISAKAYCADHPHIPLTNSGNDRKLVEILRDIVKDLTGNGSDKVMQKKLHGPMTEVAKSDGLLSVTSMNQLVHNPSFSILPGDICRLFSNIFPLLEEMN